MVELDGRGPGVEAALFLAELGACKQLVTCLAGFDFPRALKTWRDVLMFCSYGGLHRRGLKLTLNCWVMNGPMMNSGMSCDLPLVSCMSFPWVLDKAITLAEARACLVSSFTCPRRKVIVIQ